MLGCEGRGVQVLEDRCGLFLALGAAFSSLSEGLWVQAGIKYCCSLQGRWSSGEKKSDEKEWAEAEMPFYSLSLGEKEEVEELALKLTHGDSESHPEPTDQALQEKKVKVPELGKVNGGGRSSHQRLNQISTDRRGGNFYFLTS